MAIADHGRSGGVRRRADAHHRRHGGSMVAAALGVALLAACASGDSTEPTLNVDGEQVATSTLRGIVDGLCTAREQAAENREAARSAFRGRAHDPIHTLARAVQATNRAAAGELLRAKQAVEADFGEAAGGGDLEGDLQHLVEETVQALNVAGIEAKACPE